VSGDRSIHLKLTEARSWAEANSDLLRRTFERFEETAEWPQLEDLQHDFTVGGRDDIDVAALAYAMPNPLGFVEQGRLVLRVLGLSYVPSAAGVLDIWAAAIHMACQRWVHDHRTAWLTRKDVEDLTHGDRHQSDLVSILLLRERWPFGDGRGNPTDDEWSQKIIDTVRIARSTKDPATLLERRAAVEFPTISQASIPILPELEPDPASSSGETPLAPPEPRPDGEGAPQTLKGRVGRILRNPYAVVIIGGLMVLVVWAILSNGFHDVFGGGGGTTIGSLTGATSGQGAAGKEGNSRDEGTASFEEEAGEDGASTYANPYKLSETGKRVEPGQTVRVSCRVYSPEPPSVTPDGFWYRLASPPWNGRFYAPANSFWNGDVPGQLPYTHNTDKSVPICGS
jgi:hypothetical protein